MMENIILRLQTLPKYRIRNSLYLIFHLFDNFMLLSIIIVSISRAINATQLKNISEQQATVFSVFAVEIFYDIMLCMNKFWNLQRLSIWVAMWLFGIYFILLFQWLDDPEYDVLRILLGVRFMAFFLEELLDVTIDMDMHNDITDLGNEKLPHRIMTHFDDFTHLPTPDFYQGSFLIWLPYPSQVDSCRTAKYNATTIAFMYTLPALLILPFAVAVFALAGFSAAFLLLMAYCLGQDRASMRALVREWCTF